MKIKVSDLRKQLCVAECGSINVHGWSKGRSLISNYYYKNIPVCMLRFHKNDIVEYFDYDNNIIVSFKGLAQFD